MSPTPRASLPLSAPRPGVCLCVCAHIRACGWVCTGACGYVGGMEPQNGLPREATGNLRDLVPGKLSATWESKSHGGKQPRSLTPAPPQPHCLRRLPDFHLSSSELRAPWFWKWWSLVPHKINGNPVPKAHHSCRRAGRRPLRLLVKVRAGDRLRGRRAPRAVALRPQDGPNWAHPAHLSHFPMTLSPYPGRRGPSGPRDSLPVSVHSQRAAPTNTCLLVSTNTD